ncbi:MAG: DUF120 domain-containing protein [Halobacteria archaeon]
MSDILALKKLALLGAIQTPVKLSTLDFARYIQASPQTASRRFQSLEKKGLIERKHIPEGQMILLTPKGVESLKKEYSEYKKIFKVKSKPRELKGRVITGLGEGQYYMSLNGYVKQFEKILGFKPFPGTLNLQLDETSTLERKRLNHGIPLHGFKSHQRTYGGGEVYPAKLGKIKGAVVSKIKGAVVIPERTHYPPDILEFIAPFNLRQKLNLKDGDLVEVRISNDSRSH